MSRMPFRGTGPVGPSAGVHHWAALFSGVKVSRYEVNTAESSPSHANHQNDNVPGTHTRPLDPKLEERPYRVWLGVSALPAINQATGAGA
jgi:hypothetical protein